jgi:transposase
VSIKELTRRHGIDRNTVCRALQSDSPPVYRRASVSKLDPFEEEIHRLLKADPKLPGQPVRELIAPLGFEGGKTIVDDYLREGRPLFAPAPRTFQRTIYRPGEICQFDVWEPEAEVPVGHGQTRQGYVVVACLGYSRAGAGALGDSLLSRLDAGKGLAQDERYAVDVPPVAKGRWTSTIP